MSSKFYEQIKNSNIEKEVELVYKKGLEIYFPESKSVHPYGCGGYIETKLNYNEKIEY